MLLPLHLNLKYVETGGFFDFDLLAYKARRLDEEREKHREELALLESEKEAIQAKIPLVTKPVKATLAKQVHSIDEKQALIKKEMIKIIKAELDMIRRDDEEFILMLGVMT